MPDRRAMASPRDEPLHETLPAGFAASLLEFERAPGRFAIARREPRPLFDHALAVLRLATGRPVPNLDDLGGGTLDDLRRAARFFVRTAMLRAGTDHYTLMGLHPGFSPQALREHYRLLIRLTHPDFADPESPWPADAAARINLANDVLGSPVRRAEYDRSLQTQPAAPPRPTATPAARPFPAPPPVARTRPVAARPATKALRVPGWTWRWPDLSPRRQQQLKIAGLALGALLAAGALVWLTPPKQGGSLVARAPAKTAAVQPASNAPATITPPPATAAVPLPGTPNTPAPRRLGDPPVAPVPAPAMDEGAAGDDTLALAASEGAQPPQGPRPRRAPAVPRHNDVAKSNASEAGRDEAPEPARLAATPTLSVDAGAAATTVETAAVAAHAAQLAEAVPALTPPAAPLDLETAPEAKPAPASTTAAAPQAAEAPPPAETAPAPAPAPTLVAVHPTVVRLIEALQAGHGMGIVQAAHPAYRVQGGVHDFVYAFNEQLAGRRHVHLQPVAIVGKPLDTGVLMVDMHLAMTYQDATDGAAAEGAQITKTRNLRVFAQFGYVEGQPALIGLKMAKP